MSDTASGSQLAQPSAPIATQPPLPHHRPILVGHVHKDVEQKRHVLLPVDDTDVRGDACRNLLPFSRNPTRANPCALDGAEL